MRRCGKTEEMQIGVYLGLPKLQHRLLCSMSNFLSSHETGQRKLHVSPDHDHRVIVRVKLHQVDEPLPDEVHVASRCVALFYALDTASTNGV